MTAYFDVPLNLAHAATIAKRIETRLARSPLQDVGEVLSASVEELVERLGPYEGSEEEPRESEAADVVRDAAAIARRIVDEIETDSLGEDRLGQFVRNLFECLGLGEEGAAISLRAGESPSSLLRP